MLPVFSHMKFSMSNLAPIFLRGFRLIICCALLGSAASGFAQSFYKIKTVVGGGTSLTGAGLSVGLSDDTGAVATGLDGRVYFADSNRIFRYDPVADLVMLLAGTGVSGYSGDNGPSVNAQISLPSGLAVDSGNNVFIADYGNFRIRRIDGSTGVITTIAGTGTFGYSGDGGPAIGANLSSPRGIALDRSNGLLIADAGNGRIRRVDLGSGQITTVTGGGTNFTDGVPASQYGFINASALLVNDSGDLFIGSSNCGCVYRVDAASGNIATYVNSGHIRGASSNSGRTAADSHLGTLAGLATDLNGNLLVADGDSGIVIQIDKGTTIVTAIAGGGSNVAFILNDSNANDASLRTRSFASDGFGNLYLKDVVLSRLLRLAPLPASGTWQLSTKVTGSGTVSANPPGQSCGANCLAFPYGTQVTFTASPASGSFLYNWSAPACQIGATTCTVVIGSLDHLYAAFSQFASISVLKTGTGQGSVTSSVAGISCGNSCTAQFKGPVDITLHATPEAGSVFAGWASPQCPSSGDCIVSASALDVVPPISVTARFELATGAITVSFAGNGSGKVTSVPAGINCPPTCSANFAGGTQVTLTPQADPPAPFISYIRLMQFAHWSGDCQQTPCTLVAGAGKSAVASFAKIVRWNARTLLGDTIVGFNNSRLALRANDGSLLMGAYDYQSVFRFQQIAGPGPSFRFLGAPDFDGNNKSDWLFQDTSRTDGFGEVRFWRDFDSAQESVLRTVKLTWDVQAYGDMDGDGFADIVWRYTLPGSPDTGVSYIWFTDGNGVTQVRKRGGAPLSWKLLGSGDLDLDGAQDILYASPDGQLRALMATSGRTCANLSAGSVPAGFIPLKFANFTGRGQGDVLLYNPTTGQLKLLMLDAFGLDLPAPTGNPDDPNASCTSSALVIPGRVIDWATADPSWTFYATGNFASSIFDNVVFKRPDNTLMVLLGGNPDTSTLTHSFLAAGPAPAGYVPAGP